MNINEYMKANRVAKYNGLVDAVICADGFAMSVQASASHYCLPREDGAEYTHVEIGYPSSHDDMPQEYRDGDNSPFYGYVPVKVVERIIAKHGGLKGD